ncbi:MAG: hypothetical protein ACRC5M_04755 [Anaeroplasmataceae bacterium]
MAEKTSAVKRIDWAEFLTRVEKNQGVPKATVQESFKAAEKEITTILSTERNEGTTIIKTPIAAVISKFVPAHTVKDEKGKEIEYSAAYGIMTAAPTSWVKAANIGFECTKKALN